MRIREIRLFHANIPLKKRIKHASHSRINNDSLIVRCELSDGSVGWGEGLPREYVTGETINSAWQLLSEMDVKQLSAPVDSWPDVMDLLAHCTRFGHPVSEDKTQRDCFGNAARCALELSILDAFSRSQNVSISEVFQYVTEASGFLQRQSEVRYIAAITAMKPLKTRVRALLVRAYGFPQCKVKVGVAGANDTQLLKLIRRYLGNKIGIRIDANEAWKPTELLAKIQPLLKFNISSLEQPVPHEQVRELQHIKPQLGIPIMLDESLCSFRDGELAIEHNLCDIFNIRLSKCGGLVPSLKLAMLAFKHGKQIQLGCQVGETGILSAAGRHFACNVKDLIAIEGSFDRHLVKEPLTKEDLTFGYRGLGKRLTNPGLGITLDETALKRVTQRTHVLNVEG